MAEITGVRNIWHKPKNPGERDLVHSGLTGLIVDSTAEAVTRHLNCSILVVKPPEFVTPVVVEDM